MMIIDITPRTDARDRVLPFLARDLVQVAGAQGSRGRSRLLARLG